MLKLLQVLVALQITLETNTSLWKQVTPISPSATGEIQLSYFFISLSLILLSRGVPGQIGHTCSHQAGSEFELRFSVYLNRQKIMTIFCTFLISKHWFLIVACPNFMLLSVMCYQILRPLSSKDMLKAATDYHSESFLDSLFSLLLCVPNLTLTCASMFIGQNDDYYKFIVLC